MSSIIIDHYKNDQVFEQYKERYRKGLIDIYLKSSDFEVADKNFDNFIYPVCKDFSKDEVLYLISNSETNPQLTRRYGYLNNIHKSKLLELIDNVKITDDDVKQYIHFNNFYKKRNDSGEQVNTEIDDDDLPF